MPPLPRPRLARARVVEVALQAQLAHGQVLDDALLDVVEPGVIGVEDRRASVMSSASSERTPHGSSKTVSSQVRIQPCSGLCSLVRSSLSISRAIAVRVASLDRQRLQPGAVVVALVSAVDWSPSSLRMAASC